MKYLFLIIVLCFFVSETVFSQEDDKAMIQSRIQKFDPAANPADDLRAVVETTQVSGKRILLDVGGEWCKWCHLFDKFLVEHTEIGKLFFNTFEVVKVNVSKENKNEAFLSAYPKVDGYPHFFILESDGTFLHSQNTAELEHESSYSAEKLNAFILNWKK